MSEAITFKTYQAPKAPKRIEILGDKTKRPESASHVIESPGGAIELSRIDGGHGSVDRHTLTRATTRQTKTLRR